MVAYTTSARSSRSFRATGEVSDSGSAVAEMIKEETRFEYSHHRESFEHEGKLKFESGESDVDENDPPETPSRRNRRLGNGDGDAGRRLRSNKRGQSSRSTRRVVEDSEDQSERTSEASEQSTDEDVQGDPDDTDYEKRQRRTRSSLPSRPRESVRTPGNSTAKKRRITYNKHINTPYEEQEYPEEPSGPGIYTVGELRAHQRVKKRIQYLVKWHGYPSDQDTWEYEENIYDYGLLDQYWADHGGKEARMRLLRNPRRFSTSVASMKRRKEAIAHKKKADADQRKRKVAESQQRAAEELKERRRRQKARRDAGVSGSQYDLTDEDDGPPLPSQPASRYSTAIGTDTPPATDTDATDSDANLSRRSTPTNHGAPAAKRRMQKIGSRKASGTNPQSNGGGSFSDRVAGREVSGQTSSPSEMKMDEENGIDSRYRRSFSPSYRTEWEPLSVRKLSFKINPNAEPLPAGASLTDVIESGHHVTALVADERRGNTRDIPMHDLYAIAPVSLARYYQQIVKFPCRTE